MQCFGLISYIFSYLLRTLLTDSCRHLYRQRHIDYPFFIAVFNYHDIQFAFAHGSLLSIHMKDIFASDASKNMFFVL